jgi:hypothetical protein
MDRRTTLKNEILAFVADLDPTVLINESDKASLKSMLDELTTLTPVPEPIRHTDQVEGVWESLFTSFGAKHSDDQPMKHTTTLAVQSFGNFPMVPVHVNEITQEILSETQAYNNVVFVQNEDRSANAIIVVEGNYSEDPEDPKRFQVSFSGVSLNGADGQSDAELREQFGLDPDEPLRKEFRPPALHSDIVYLDEDVRINYGKLGGFYLLRRLDREGYSIAYPAAA